MAKPILKWAGGKTQLLKTIELHLPKKLKENKIKKYVEPFVGGGALFFYLKQNYNIKQAYISDINEELVLLYRVIQTNVNDLIYKLLVYEDMFFTKNNQDLQSELFYKVRDEFNQTKQNTNYERIFDFEINRVAQLIFLNKTCFNGLFRVNKSGYFNVPFGKYKKPSICDKQNLLDISQLLQETTISHNDFSNIPQEFLEDSFIYFDPPYRPLNQTSSFTSYTKFDFNDEKQKELSTFFKTISSNNYLMLSNSDPKNNNTNDDFFDKIYEGMNIYRIQANRMINSKGADRGKINELLITNYET